MKNAALANRVLYIVNLACLATLTIFQLTPAHTRVGQLLYWPQTYFHFLHISDHSAAGAKLMMLVCVVMISAVGLLCLEAYSEQSWSLGMLRAFPGVLALIAPLISWFLLAPFDVVVRTLTMIETTALIIFSVFLLKRSPSINTWTVPVVTIVCFGFWFFLYWRFLEPITVIMPIISAASYVAWAAYVVDAQKSPELKPV